MFLFKASRKTYWRVAKQSLHAFPFSPKEAEVGQMVLLSKNREDLRRGEKQIQFVAKILAVRPATPAELEERFPGVGAGERFRFIAELYWLEKLDNEFDLSQVPGFNSRRYDSVQDFAKLDAVDESAMISFLAKRNERVLLSYLNRDDLPESLARLHERDAG
jgi:hypothetical protein